MVKEGVKVLLFMIILSKWMTVVCDITEEGLIYKMYVTARDNMKFSEPTRLHPLFLVDITTRVLYYIYIDN